jgi:hypothetical protein
MTVDERQVGFAPAVVFKTSQRVEIIVAVLVKVETELKMEVDTELVENVPVVKRVWVGVGVQAIPSQILAPDWAVTRVIRGLWDGLWTL